MKKISFIIFFLFSSSLFSDDLFSEYKEKLLNIYKKNISKPSLECKGDKSYPNTLSWDSTETFFIVIEDYLNPEDTNFGRFEWRSYKKDGRPRTPHLGDMYWEEEETNYGSLFTFKVPEYESDVLNRIDDPSERLVGLIKFFEKNMEGRMSLGESDVSNIEITTHNTIPLTCLEISESL